eukprot:scaffold11651_cov118-Isochrysis_galbana.AAC.4
MSGVHMRETEDRKTDRERVLSDTRTWTTLCSPWKTLTRVAQSRYLRGRFFFFLRRRGRRAGGGGRGRIKGKVYRRRLRRRRRDIEIGCGYTSGLKECAAGAPA